MMFRNWIIYFLIGTLLLVTGCTSRQAMLPGQAPTLKIALEDYGYPSPYTFYPRGPGYLHMSFLFDTLLWKDENGIIPWLSETYEVSSDGKKWTFHIQPGVKWHDGNPLTAEDVEFTYNYVKNHPHPWFSREINMIDKIERKEPDQVVITLHKPYAPFLTNIAATIPIMPKHIWKDIDDPMKFTGEQSVIGSGPFKLSRYEKANALYIYEANMDYFKGQPKVAKIVFTQPGQPLLALQKGEVDVFNPDIDQADVLRKTPHIEVLEGNSFWVFRLMFNLSMEPFDQVPFRQAIAYALDLQDIVTRAMHDGAIPGSYGYVSPQLTDWYNPHARNYPHSPEKAKELLSQIGYATVGPDGIRSNADGKKLSFELLASQQGEEAELIKKMLAEVGIEVKIKALEKGMHDTLIDTGQFQMAINGHGGVGGDPIFLNQLTRSLTSLKSNPSLYQNPEYMRLLEMQAGITDTNERKRVVYQLQDILAEDVPTIPLYYKKMFVAYRPEKLTGWFFTPGGIATGIPTGFNKVIFLNR